MTLNEIKAAVMAGRVVNWANDNYEVRVESGREYFYIICLSNGSIIGLTWLDGVTLNGDGADFFIKEEA